MDRRYHEVVGKGNCPIVDTWWQTETGGMRLAHLYAMAVFGILPPRGNVGRTEQVSSSHHKPRLRGSLSLARRLCHSTACSLQSLTRQRTQSSVIHTAALGHKVNSLTDCRIEAWMITAALSHIGAHHPALRRWQWRLRSSLHQVPLARDDAHSLERSRAF